ncbi:MAG: hypothetical protein NTX55_02385 [Candidatus Parcubacteria bacterium]|nr:hypothetical protein [Candidatus Parcubacteria bacterium]
MDKTAPKKNIEWFILIIYTLINIWILSFFLFDSGSFWGAIVISAGNSNLLAIFIGLFLNTGLILYTKLITNRKLEAILLLIYSYLNLRAVFQILLAKGGLASITMAQGVTQGGAHNLFGMVIGLFLNAILIIYWLRRTN